jgi:tetratricopeptide (TPR) repeat protein
MKKDNLLFAIIGLLVGLIVGFLGTNQLNRSQNNQIAASSSGSQTPSKPASGNPGAAVPAVAEAISKADTNLDDFAAQIKAGEMFARIKNFPKAIEYFERANKIKPDDYETLVLLGNSSYDAETWEAAASWYEKALAKKPEDVAVRTDLGVTYLRRPTPDYQRAIKEFVTSLKTDPNHEATLFNLSIAYLNIGDTAAANEAKAKIKDPDLLKKLDAASK